MRKIRFAFAGFRHAHIGDLWQRAQNHPEIEIVAACEEAPDDRLLDSLNIQPTHHSLQNMLDTVDFDVLAIGDSYSNRGALAISALSRDKHVISDKPLCTTLDELTAIKTLSASKNLAIGLMLDAREHENLITLRHVLISGEIGETATVSVTGQHPLLRDKRPAWYFEPGLHGGTLNDIAIHAMDLIPWMTGHSWNRIQTARTWNGKATDRPYFQDCAQFMMVMDNGAGVLGDVSYLAPDETGYAADEYWRVLVHGTCGKAETSLNAPGVRVATDYDKHVRLLEPLPKSETGYLADFLSELRGNPCVTGLNTCSNLTATSWALELELTAARHHQIT